MIRVICSGGLELAIDPEDIRETCPPVLARFLGLVDGFAEPNRDEEGRLTFAKDFRVARTDFVRCISFLRSENVTCSFEKLMETFNILGGCDRLDELYAEQKQYEKRCEAEQKQYEKRCEENPTTPGEDNRKMYVWRAAPSVHDLSVDGWCCMSRVPETLHEYWYRKPI